MTDFDALFSRTFGDVLGSMFGGIGSTAAPPDSVPLRILGLDVDELPSGEVITKAFRRRVMELHPDLDAYSALPGEATLAVLEQAKNDATVQEAMWARDVLLKKCPDKSTPGARRYANPEQEAYEKARAEEQAKLPERPPLDVTNLLPRREPRKRRDRRPVTQGCAGCGKPFEPFGEIWKVRTTIRTTWPHTTTRRRFCADCGPQQFPSATRWPSISCPGPHYATADDDPHNWRSRCERCDRVIVLVDSSLCLWWCHCSEPRLMPFPTSWSADAQKCVKCQNWRPRLDGWTCTPACSRALRRAETREPRPGRPCEVCGELLDGGRADARYCSSACRQRAYRSRTTTAATATATATATKEDS